MKKIILLLLVLMVLIGAGVGGYVLFGPKPPDPNAVAEEPKPAQRPSGQPLFVTIGPLIVPVIGEKRVEQNVMLMVSLEVYGDATRERVRQQTPRLNDAFLRALYGAIESRQVIDGQILNVNGIRDVLLPAAESVVGPGVVWDVLIQAVNQRPAH